MITVMDDCENSKFKFFELDENLKNVFDKHNHHNNHVWPMTI